MMNTQAVAGSVYALLADGTTIEIRPATPDDLLTVEAMHQALSQDNTCRRFSGLSRPTAENEARRICRDPAPGHVSLLALLDGEIIADAIYEAAGDTAEVVFTVAERMHGRGVATLLLEHLISLAKSRGIRAFTAQTRRENTAVLEVFADAGLPVHRHCTGGIIDMTFTLLPETTGTAEDASLDAVTRRERGAEAASLRHIFAPESVVVVGASRRQGKVGRSVLDNIRFGGYVGHLYAVNPHARQIDGERCLPSVAALPEPADLAVLAVPPAAVLDVAEQCGQRGVRSLVVLTSGLDTAACADLLATCRRHGMRLIGPNCFGIAVPGIGLDATFAASHPAPGGAGLVMQSGGLGFAMVDHLSRLGIGISSFASVGNKLDVSSNDMLMWWEQDEVTRLAVLYIESFGNPRKFARTARRVGARMPVLTVHAGRSAAGKRAAASHTAAIATPLVSREALFEQAGIIATPGFGELVEATALLATQPPPAGRTVAIVSNVGGAGVLAADACTDLGLTVHHPRGQVKRKLHAMVPDGGAVTGPVDTTATVSGADFRQILELLAADGDVDAMIALVLPTGATGDLVAAIQEADIPVPLAAVLLGQAEAARVLDAKAGKLPAYGYPEAAAGALARAAKYGQWRTAPRGEVPEFPEISADRAKRLIHEFLGHVPGGGWLPRAEAAELLSCFGVPLAGLRPARTEDDAVAAAAAAGYPVVLKADVPGLVHKTDAGGVLLDLRTEDDVRTAWRTLSSRFGKRLRSTLVQPMITGGTEVIIGVRDDHMFGPLIVFGLGDVATEVLADHAARLAPLTDTDADKLIHSIRSAPLLTGYRGAPAADTAALRDVLLRVSRLADDLPEVSDLDLNPVIARADGVFAVDMRIKVAPYEPRDPFLRELR
jgi:acyl-CoA synthetase (NDP forming)/GNAT superfamily N-acetyltransferase